MPALIFHRPRAQTTTTMATFNDIWNLDHHIEETLAVEWQAVEYQNQHWYTGNLYKEIPDLETAEIEIYDIRIAHGEEIRLEVQITPDQIKEITLIWKMYSLPDAIRMITWMHQNCRHFGKQAGSR